ncbi:helicase [Spirochaetia bacterium]|nr:helicase [Spirochaetia bacterium]
MDKSSIRDNHKHGSVGEFLQESIAENADMSVVSAYFTIHAWDRLKTAFQKLGKFRFLFGEPTFVKSVSLNDENLNTRTYKFEDDSLHIKAEKQLTQGAIARSCAAWLREKAEIRSMVKPNFLHGKMYHITETGGRQKAIVGSSNFTVHGLGMGQGADKNIELNMIIDSDRDREALLEWFNEIWDSPSELVEDVKEKVLGYLEQLYAENSPEFIYYKTLYHIFSAWLTEQKEGKYFNEKTSLYESEIWNCLYDFQKDGVKGAIHKILKYSGCIIADSVGLGKTYEALAVIKYFEAQNARVLVICPKKLSKNWTVYQSSQNQEMNPFKKDRFNYSVLYHTDMGRASGKSSANNIDLASFDWSAYDLVVIDESHNFRGNAEVKEKEGVTVMNRASWLMEKIIRDGYQTKVLLLSATPVNNTLRDLRNQIAFITGGKEDALLETCDIASYSEILRIAQANFTRWADPKNKDKRTKELLQRLDAGFFKLLDELTIARSRKHISGFYDMEAIGSFPRREKPLAIYPEIDTKNYFPSYDRIKDQIDTYQLSIFNPSKYIKDDKKASYESAAAIEGQKQFTQAGREHFLIGMMRVNFLKRLESSIESFKITLDRTIKKIDIVLGRIKDFDKTKNKNDTIIEEIMPSTEELESESWDAEDAEAWLVGKKIKFRLEDLKLDEWASDLLKDRDALVSLYNNASAVNPERDAKLGELKKIILEKINNPFNKDNKKIIIFTAFYDTAEYLYNNLEPWITKELHLESALVYGSGSKTTFGKNDYDSILTNFSPRAKNRAHNSQSTLCNEKEIDLLFATDCISEGQNLQDCDFMVNYDIHWNPVRIIQRFGRIDRIGSVNETIKLVNFWPTNDLEKYINLKSRVESRMALVDISATADDNILKSEQIEELVSDELNYRNSQLLRLKDEILDLEDMDETISLTDFTLDDFRLELSDFIANNKKRLEDSPLGMYAIGKCKAVPKDSMETEIITPGVIFCLAQKKNDAENNKINPLNPYYLVYIRDNGDVRYTYTHSKQILEMFRQICQGENTAYENLCALFNAETDKGKDMTKYSALLKKAAEATIQTAGKKGNLNLLSGRGGLLIPQTAQVSAMDDFELVTWLVLKQE